MSPRRPRKASQLATALIEHSSDAIALVDEAGTVLYANPAAARMLGLEDELGTLRAGAVADVTVLEDRRGRFSLRDNSGTEVVAERVLMPELSLRAGRRVDADAPILPEPVAA